MKEIPLTKGYVALVSDEDYERVAQFKWHAIVGRRVVYAARAVRKLDGKQTAQYLHRFILGLTDPAIHVDHPDLNGLNNQRSNLRTCTRSQNAANTRKKSGEYTSKFKGVYWRKPGKRGKNGKWTACILLNGKQRYLGGFTTEEAAHEAYKAAAQKHRGVFARARRVTKALKSPAAVARAQEAMRSRAAPMDARDVPTLTDLDVIADIA